MTNPTIRILRRPIQVIQTNEENALPAVPSKTLEEREAYYASVRRRIMGTESLSISSDSDEFIDSDVSPDGSQVDEDQGKSADSEKVSMANRNKVTTTTLSPPIGVPSTKSSPPSSAIPLMSIPTAALSLPTSLEHDSRVLNFILPPGQNQMPILGAPQSPSLTSKHRHSDTPLSRGFGSASKVLGPFASPPSRSSLPSALPQPPAKPLGVHNNLLQQYQLINWQVLYQPFQQTLQQHQNHLQQQQQSFLPPSIVYESGIFNHLNNKQGIIQGSNFYQPSSR